MIVCSVAACVIQLRHEVSLGAVCRYFTRPFYAEPNLERELRSHLTTAQLSALFVNESTMNLGGFVYRHEGTLHFYPHTTRAGLARRADQAQNEAVFPELMKHYRAGDVHALVAGLSEPAIRARLVREGVGGAEIDLLCRKVELAEGELDRIRVLRATMPHLEHFTPYEGEPYQLTFQEKLRFYDHNRPQGEFVGTFEVLGLRAGFETDDEYGRSMATQSHYLAVLRLPGNRILVKDYYRNRLRTYTIRAIEHPSGRILFKVA